MAEHISEDVIAKIFQRLPVKSLIRFTSVSKRWRLIILRDPHFAASHYQIASHNKTLRHSVCYCRYLDSDRFFESQTTSSSFPIVKRDIRCPFKKPHSMVYVYCSCRGLAYAGVNGKQEIEMYVWNPSTGLSQKLPDPGVTEEYQIFTGFGYVSATDEYKILTLYGVVYVCCSCRGMAFAVFQGKQKIEWYIWNPSTGLSQKLPDLGGPNEFLNFTGFGSPPPPTTRFSSPTLALRRESKPRSTPSRRNPNHGEGFKIFHTRTCQRQWRGFFVTRHFIG